MTASEQIASKITGNALPYGSDANAALQLVVWMAENKALWYDGNRSLNGKWRANFRPSQFDPFVASTNQLATLGAFLRAAGHFPEQMLAPGQTL